MIPCWAVNGDSTGDSEPRMARLRSFAGFKLFPLLRRRLTHTSFLESLAGQFAMLPRRRSGGRRKALLEKVLGYLPPPKTE